MFVERFSREQVEGVWRVPTDREELRGGARGGSGGKAVGKRQENVLEGAEGSKGDRPLNRLDHKDLVRENGGRAREFGGGELLELRNCDD